MSLRRLGARLELPVLHAGWFLVCASLLAFMLVTRWLYYAVNAIPEPLDRALGVLLVYQALLFFYTWIITTMLLEPLVAALLLGLLLARRRLFERRAEGLCMHPLLHTLLWTGFVLAHAAFDLNPLLAGPCLASLPLLAVDLRGALARRAAARGALLLAIAGAGAWVWIRGDGWSLFALALFAGGLALLLRAPALLRDRLTLAVALVAFVQCLAAVGPSLLPTHGGELLVRDMAYSFCESERHGRLYAALTRCSTLPSFFLGREPCQRGAVAEFDLRDLSLRRELGFFAPDYYGRLEQLVCLDDAVEIGLNGMMLDGQPGRDGSISFEIEHPERFVRDRVGAGQAHRIAWDERRDALFYAPEWGVGIRRYARRSGEIEWIRVGQIERPPLPVPGGVWDSFEFGPESIHRDRDTIFFGEWLLGSAVREIDLETLDLVRTHAHRNGGTVGVSVDEAHDRLYVVGLWGMSVRDLAGNRIVWKTRLGFLSRAPVIDPDHGLVYVSSTVEGRIHVFDRETLKPRGTLPIGFGVRLLHLSPATGRLFASSWRAAWSFPTAELAR